MVNENILKSKGFSKKEIEIIKKHFKHLYKLYVYIESNIFDFLNYINLIQSDLILKYVNNWVFEFNLIKTNKSILIDLLSSNL